MTDKLVGFEMENTVGIQLQNDNIFVGLNHTEDRQILEVWRADHVIEKIASAYFQNTVHWVDKFRTVAGIRGDFIWINDYAATANSGKTSDG